MSTIVARCTNLNTKMDKARMMMFRRVEEGKIQRWIRLHDPSHHCRRQQEDSGREHRDDHAGVQPVQPLPLIESAVKKS